MSCILPSDLIKKIITYFPETFEGQKDIRSFSSVCKLFYSLIHSNNEGNYLSPFQKLILNSKITKFTHKGDVHCPSRTCFRRILAYLAPSIDKERLVDIQNRLTYELLNLPNECLITATQNGCYIKQSHRKHHTANSIRFLYQDFKTKKSQCLSELTSYQAIFLITKEELILIANKTDLTSPIKIYKDDQLLYEITLPDDFKSSNYSIANLDLANNQLLVILTDSNKNKDILTIYNFNDKRFSSPIELNDALDFTLVRTSHKIHKQCFFSIESLLKNYRFNPLWDGNNFIIFGLKDKEVSIVKVDTTTGQESLIHRCPYKTNHSNFHIGLFNQYFVFSDSDEKCSIVINLQSNEIINKISSINSFTKNTIYLEKDKLVVATNQDPKKIKIFSIFESQEKPLWQTAINSPISEVKLVLDPDFPHILAKFDEHRQFQVWDLKNKEDPTSEEVIVEFSKGDNRNDLLG